MEWVFLIGIAWIVYSLGKRSGKKSQNQSSFSYQKQTINNVKPKQLNVRQIDISNITLSDEQKKLFDNLEKTNACTFITGKAGTGKSVLLQYFKQHSSKKLVVVAPTGVAALNVGGQTIHSLFRIKPGFIKKDSLPMNHRTATLLRNIDTVVIDEISMVRADLMDGIDNLLRQARHNDLPFGGVQIVMFGDLYQLPPVVGDPELHKYFADNHGGFYFFNAHVWKNCSLEIYELNKIFRQKDEEFRKILNSIRKGIVNEEMLNELNHRVTVIMPEEGVITLATTNSSVNEINNYHLSKINDPLYEYRARIYGSLDPSAFPTEEILKLKKGAQVMIIKNDKEKRWVNGDIGIVESLSNTEINLNIGGIVYSLPQETWNKVRYYYDQEKKSIEEEVISSFTQFPLRLAWAITIHKSQGQTYNSVAVDMGDGAFAHGQTYVGLSRCRSLEGLYLKREVMQEDIIVDPVVVAFMRNQIVLGA